MERLKKEFLELLEKDLEFRYAVAGYLGLSEILKRLDVIAEGQVKIWSEIAKLREEQARTWSEIERLREEQAKMWEEIKALREEQARTWSEIERLREDFNSMYRQLDLRLTRVERTLEKITVDVEEEARIVVKHRLKEIGYDVDVTSLILPELELNIYGVLGDLCIIGEASVRASSSVIDEINQKIEKLRRVHPDKLRPRIVRVVYVGLALPDLLERAEKEGVWVLKAAGDLVRPRELLC
ncbi:MAG: hypothetical protein N3F04_05555 [Candidatus Nezhaarchaeota archaeon]|nr:hypothetical protein [Candidatus Nezhaarchaeota archaeon]MCX8142208.1 hypothetical protein [Candidatus Nezhaarchaeota archaeon]MDW8050008.1 hypothetical protein [Nitrososphaerota archaeon]